MDLWAATGVQEPSTATSLRNRNQGDSKKMKNTLVRALVVALAVAGFSASTVSAKSTVKPSVNAVPAPVCAPGSPDGCGID